MGTDYPACCVWTAEIDLGEIEESYRLGRQSGIEGDEFRPPTRAAQRIAWEWGYAAGTLDRIDSIPSVDPEPINGERSINANVAAGFVVTEDGRILVQMPDPESHWGFYLADDDQTWPGGIGAAMAWELIADNDPRITPQDHDRLDWVLNRS